MKKLSLLLLILFIGFSCKKDKENPPSEEPLTIYERSIQELEAAGGYDQFATLMKKVDKNDMIKNGPVTLFVPSDSAMNSFLDENDIQYLDDLTINNMFGYITYSYINGMPYYEYHDYYETHGIDPEIPDSFYDFLVGPPDTRAYIGKIMDHNIVRKIYESPDLNIMEIDGLLHRPATVQELVAMNPDLSIYLAVLNLKNSAPSFSDMIEKSKKSTLLALNNRSFNKIEIYDTAFWDYGEEYVEDILATFAFTVSTTAKFPVNPSQIGKSFTAINSMPMYLGFDEPTLSKGYVFLNDQDPTIAGVELYTNNYNIHGSNGVIHMITDVDTD